MPRSKRMVHISLDTAWNGKKAAFVSTPGPHGTIPFSEQSVHMKAASKPIKRYALFKETGEWRWAHVETPDGRVVDGLPSEVLPPEVLEEHDIAEQRGQEDIESLSFVQRVEARYRIVTGMKNAECDIRQA
jgi:hypothetical protein